MTQSFEPLNIMLTISNDISKLNPDEKALANIVQMVRDELSDVLMREELNIKKCHPKDLIAVLTTNILMNLFIDASETAPNLSAKQAMLQSLLEQVTELSMKTLEVQDNFHKEKQNLN